MSDAALTEPLYIDIETYRPGGQVTLRADLSVSAVAKVLTEVTGLEMPGTLKVTQNGAARAVWMSPDELLLLVSDAAACVAQLTEALEGHHHMALDVSDARTVLRLTGDSVGEVLAKGVPCDVSDHGCPPGTARRTHLAGLAVGLWRLDDKTWEVVCFRSFAHHLEAWLATAATEGAQVG